MIAFTPSAQPADPARLDHPGGFTWWYLDLVDPDPDRGRGLVLIWSWGLPFLPGLDGPARTGNTVSPRARPAINVAAYDRGAEAGWLLQELDPAQVAWQGPTAGGAGAPAFPMTSRWRFGGAELEQTLTDDRVDLRATLDLPLPGGQRLTGQIEIGGPRRRGADPVHAPDGPAAPADHEWSPLCLSTSGRADLRWGDQPFTVAGPAYHDRNASSRPLFELGIGRWWWGRLALPGRELVWYRLVPDDPAAPTRELVVEVRADGLTRQIEAPIEVLPGRRSPWGLVTPSRLRFVDPDGAPVEVQVDARVEDSPFYQRYLLRGRCGDAHGVGLGETVSPAHTDPGWMRPLIRMRVMPGQGKPSMWAPLFTGPRAGRVARLLGVGA